MRIKGTVVKSYPGREYAPTKFVVDLEVKLTEPEAQMIVAVAALSGGKGRLQPGVGVGVAAGKVIADVKRTARAAQLSRAKKGGK